MTASSWRCRSCFCDSYRNASQILHAAQGVLSLDKVILPDLHQFSLLVAVLQVCKEWHSAIKGDDDLWKHHALRKFSLLNICLHGNGTRGADLIWEATYKRLASSQSTCYDCAASILRRKYGGWKPRLCQDCSEVRSLLASSCFHTHSCLMLP